ncbi:hypothetical protein OJ252_2627 [Cryptosporidium canis]|uniref:Uncharacterized protein n=1 Tax=Cryptosporidium canis TaxID=195482 RepID=A0ABQ8P4P0_9CRYT|nr:hypothetical protein OJ252_2627 [Cryptosporidium canis]
MDSESGELCEGQIVIDGETEIDDLLLASKFAELENYKSASILTEVQSSRARRPLSERSSEDVDIVLTDEEYNCSDDNDYKSSEDEDREIQELVRKEMIYRRKTPEGSSSKHEGLGEKLSDGYLSQFGISLEKSKGTKGVLSDISECENEIAESEDEAVGGGRSSRAGKDGGADNAEDKQSWLPNIEILDMPEKVDVSLPCEFVGEIYSVINDGAIFGMEGIFIVKSDPTTIILDLGSILCLEDKTIVGAIIDTFGPVTSPFYVLSKQNSVDQNLLQIGTRIYCDRRHSTIVGKAGKLKSSYLSSTSPVSKKSTLFTTNPSKSPFSNKEFKKDPKAKVQSSNRSNSKDDTSVGSEYDHGEMHNGYYNEEEDEDDGQEESGDDIGAGMNGLSIRKFVEKYENLGYIQESAVEDFIASKGLASRQKQPPKQSNLGQSGRNRNNRRPQNQRGQSSLGMIQHRNDNGADMFRRPVNGGVYFGQSSPTNFEHGFVNPNHLGQNSGQIPGAGLGYNGTSHHLPSYHAGYNQPLYKAPENTFIPQGIQHNNLPMYYNGNNSSEFPIHHHHHHQYQYQHQHSSTPPPQTQAQHIHHNLSQGPHFHSPFYQETEGTQHQNVQLVYQNQNPAHAPAGFEGNQYMINGQYTNNNQILGNPFIYTSNNATQPGFPPKTSAGNYMEGGIAGSIPGEANFPPNNLNRHNM